MTNSRKHIRCLILGLLVATTGTRALGDDSSSHGGNMLDPTLRLLALQLFKDTSNTGLFNKVLASFPGGNNVQTLPTDRLGRMYRDYTNKQIEALQDELAKEDTQIYQAMKAKTQQIKMSWTASVSDYEATGDIKTFEGKFLQTGNNLVSLQKLVIRVVNSAIAKTRSDQDLTQLQQQRQGKNIYQCIQYFQNFWQLFERFLIGGNGFGLSQRSTDSDGTTSSDNSLGSTINQLYILLTELQQTGNLSDEGTREKLENIRRLVRRIRQIQQLNKIGSTPNMYLATDNVSPYSFEAVLRLVSLLGTSNSATSPANSVMQQMLGTFRTWVNLFQGGSIFQLVTSPTFSTTYNRKYDSNSISRMIKLLRLMEQRRLSQIDNNNNKVGSDLQTIIKNQNQQQQQINQILEMLNNKTMGNIGGHRPQPPMSWPAMTTSSPTTSFTLYPPGIGDILGDNDNGHKWGTKPGSSGSSYPGSSSSGSSYPGSAYPSNTGGHKKPTSGDSSSSQWPSTGNTNNQGNNQNDILKQLKDQRKHLNNLLNELQQPFEVVSSGSTTSPVMGGSATTWNPSGYQPSNADVNQAQQSMMNILKNMTPMINALGQMGMVSMPKIDSSKVELLSILNSVGARDLDGEEEPVKEMLRVTRLGQKLAKIVDSIIIDAEISTF